MREIKFRAWDKKRKIMMENVSTGTVEIFDGGFVANSKDCVLMQYTGIRDKNGKEIYEGDIIEFDKYEWYRSPVITRSDIDNLPVYREIIEFSYAGVSRGKHDLETYCTVIGNIYENPELLNPVKEGLNEFTSSL